jgi:hypothetical protein
MSTPGFIHKETQQLEVGALEMAMAGLIVQVQRGIMALILLLKLKHWH